MTEKDLNKTQFLRLLNLEATPENESSMVLENNVHGLLNQYSTLLEKNLNTKTGYENFCIKKGSTKLYPFIDFDFFGKNVVCQKCCQKFASKVSYKAHIGTDICVRTYNGPNLVYLNYKNRNGRRVRKKNKNKSIEDLIGHDIKKNLLNPEMLNTLQTRNNCYSDVVHQRNKVREKQKISSTKSDEPAVKKPRGRPRKIVEVSGEPKKRGRPKKYIPAIVDNVSETENSLNSNIESHETESNEPSMNGCSVDDAYNNNLNENEKQTALFSKIKMLTNKFWSIFSPSSPKKSDTYTVGYQHSVENCDPCINEKLSMSLSVTREKKVLISAIGNLENDIKILYEQLKRKKEYSVHEDLQSMLFKLMEKCKEYKQSILKTDMIDESTTNKGKENIHCTEIQNVGGMERDMNKMDFDTNVNVENWLNNDNKDAISPTISTISTDDYESGSGMSTDIISLEREISNDSFEDNRHFTSISDWKMHHSEHSTLIIKDSSVRSSLIDSIRSEEETYNISYEDDVNTSIEDKTPNYTNSVNNHLNNVDLNYNCNHMLNCKFCGRNFASIAEMKMHRSEHFTLVNKQNQFLCTICGIKFKMYKNYIKHVNVHRKKERKNKDYKNHSNKFKCKVCNKHFNFLRSYYVHIKNHRK